MARDKTILNSLFCFKGSAIVRKMRSTVIASLPTEKEKEVIKSGEAFSK